MTINYRILSFVACAVIIAGAAVVITTRTKPLTSVVENVPAQGNATIDRSPVGFQMQINSAGLTLSLPGCDAKKFPDKFFLHLYTEAGLKKVPAEMVNFDFFLSQEKSTEVVTNGVKTCLYYKSFSEFAVKEVTFGQFTAPNNQCCTIMWSRSFILDKTLAAKS